jgi:hypothetical protein
MPLQFLIAMWGAWIGLGIIVASEALGKNCHGADERGYYGTRYGDGPNMPAVAETSADTVLPRASPSSAELYFPRHKSERKIPVIRQVGGGNG